MSCAQAAAAQRWRRGGRAAGADLLGRGLSLRQVQVDDDHTGAIAREGLRDFQAYDARGAGDNRDLSVELHGSGSGSLGAHSKPACSKVHVWYTRWYDEIGFRVRHHNINRNTGRRLDQRRFAIKE